MTPARAAAVVAVVAVLVASSVAGRRQLVKLLTRTTGTWVGTIK